MRANKRGAFRIWSACGVFQAMRGHVIGEDLVEGAVVDRAAKANIAFPFASATTRGIA
jgi:hypothetical protein